MKAAIFSFLVGAVLYSCSPSTTADWPSVSCTEAGKPVLDIRGQLSTYKGSVKIYAADGRFIVPASTWACFETTQ